MEQFANPEIMKSLPLSEKIFDALMVMGLGMGIVFLVLMLLYLSIVILSRLVNGAPKKEKAPAPQALPATPATEAPVDEEEAEVAAVLTAALKASQEDEDIEELMVVLLTAMMLTENQTPKLRITNVRRASEPIPAWGAAALAANMRKLPF